LIAKNPGFSADLQRTPGSAVLRGKFVQTDAGDFAGRIGE